MSDNPYEPPKALTQEPVRRARQPIGRPAVIVGVVLAVLAAIALYDAAIVQLIKWEAKSRVQSAPENPPDSP